MSGEVTQATAQRFAAIEAEMRRADWNHAYADDLATFERGRKQVAHICLELESLAVIDRAAARALWDKYAETYNTMPTVLRTPEEQAAWNASRPKIGDTDFNAHYAAERARFLSTAYAMATHNMHEFLDGLRDEYRRSGGPTLEPSARMPREACFELVRRMVPLVQTCEGIRENGSVIWSAPDMTELKDWWNGLRGETLRALEAEQRRQYFADAERAARAKVSS